MGTLKVAENFKPEMTIALVFVVLPVVLVGVVFGQFKMALVIALPGILTEAWAIIIRVRGHFS
jgi:hypothetical protein